MQTKEQCIDNAFYGIDTYVSVVDNQTNALIQAEALIKAGYSFNTDGCYIHGALLDLSLFKPKDMLEQERTDAVAKAVAQWELDNAAALEAQRIAAAEAVVDAILLKEAEEEAKAKADRRTQLLIDALNATKPSEKQVVVKKVAKV